MPISNMLCVAGLRRLLRRHSWGGNHQTIITTGLGTNTGSRIIDNTNTNGTSSARRNPLGLELAFISGLELPFMFGLGLTFMFWSWPDKVINISGTGTRLKVW